MENLVTTEPLQLVAAEIVLARTYCAGDIGELMAPEFSSVMDTVCWHEASHSAVNCLHGLPPAEIVIYHLAGSMGGFASLGLTPPLQESELAERCAVPGLSDEEVLAKLLASFPELDMAVVRRETSEILKEHYDLVERIACALISRSIGQKIVMLSPGGVRRLFEYHKEQAVCCKDKAA